MKILVLNCGSSSVKFQLIDMSNEDVLAKGIVERVGFDDSILKYKPKGGEKTKEILSVKDHDVAIKVVIDTLMHTEYGAIKNINEIVAVGHRVVHGADKFANSVLIDDEVMKCLYSCIRFAPLHNPPNIKGIEAVTRLMPKVPQVGVFDTAFHQTMSPIAYLYGLPYYMYEKHHIRRYGFHGTSHKYIAHKAAEYAKKPIEELKIITNHLGNGASIAAIEYGKSVDTSMGFTPLEGLIMGTRCGDIDPAIVPYIMDLENLSIKEVDSLLNKKSGVLGLSELSSDMREIEDAALEGVPRQKLVLDIYVRRIVKYIGAYAAVMNGVDIIVFTGGVGENSPITRKWVCDHLGYLGVEVDDAKNDTDRDVIFTKGKTMVMRIPTDEELAIARDTKEILIDKKLL